MHATRILGPAFTVAVAAGLIAQDQSLNKALARADMHNKRVLAILVADEVDLAGPMKKAKDLRKPLSYEFEVVQFQGKQADMMAVKFDFAAAVQKKPAALILDSKSKVLARMGASDLDAKPADFLEKLEPHYCAPIDAEKKLAAALVEAKKTGRSVFIRFDAPW